MSNRLIIDLYTDLANDPDKDFGWDKGLQNAINHCYKEEWIKRIPTAIWKYCAAVGNPFNVANITQGDSVLDIGCGAGVDLCVASLLVGESGKVFGIDITPAMVETARSNAALAELTNISVSEGSLDTLPFDDECFNIVISNGAINLSSSKQTIFSEVLRVLQHGGGFYFSDMIRDDNNMEPGSCSTESWADCVAGTLKSDELIQLMEEAGFVNVQLSSTNHYKTSASTVGATFIAMKTSNKEVEQ
ncbi:MAG: methyltransferase domain-containing protein [Gammaproteobacteria bacterium]|nr:methyltransferase domain-containing protein [Gammaproteobacteria bacterium]